METIDLEHENESDVKAITDTDFIENYIPSYKDLYNLVYGIFYLSDEEYSDSIRRTKIVILPYKDDYKNQSSGVVYDVLFRGKPVLTRKYDNFKFINSYHVGETYDKTIDEIDLDLMVQKAQSGWYYEQVKKFITQNRNQIKDLEHFIKERVSRC